MTGTPKTIKGREEREREKKKSEAIKVMRMTLTRLREVRYSHKKQ